MPQSKCPSCQADVTENARFCPECGVSLTETRPQSPNNRKSSTAWRDSLIIAGVLIIVGAGYFIVNRPQEAAEPVAEIVPDHPEVEGMGAMAAAFANLPTDYAGLVQMGNQTMDQGNFAMAAECYKRALAINDQSSEVRTDYGACLHGMGLADRAIAEFRRVLQASPRHPIATFNMGIVYYNENQQDSAKVYWNRYLEIEPNGQLAATVKQMLSEIGG